jgi:hypothetical protein
VARIPPQTPSDELLLTWRLVLNVVRKLGITHNFNYKAKNPNHCAQIVRPIKGVIRGVNRRKKSCGVDDNTEYTLHHENEPECNDIIRKLAVLHPIISHVLVPEVLLCVANPDMQR